jgi:hypothetical protein
MKRIAFVLGILMILAAPLYAAPTELAITDFLDMVNRPLNGVVSTGISGGEPLPGLPNLTVGTGAAAYKVDYKDINTGEAKTAYFPTIFATARIGLFGGIGVPGFSGLGSVAIGGRYGVITSGPKDTVSVTGAELRVGIMNDSIATPGIAVSATYNKVSDIKFGSDTDDAQATIKAHNLGVKALVSKDLLIITPYAGIGVDKNTTTASYRITSLGVDKTWDKTSTDMRWLVGLEVSPLPFFRLGVEYNSVAGDSAYALSLRFKL